MWCAYIVWWRYLRKNVHLKGISTDGKITLNYILCRKITETIGDIVFLCSGIYHKFQCRFFGEICFFVLFQHCLQNNLLKKDGKREKFPIALLVKPFASFHFRKFAVWVRCLQFLKLGKWRKRSEETIKLRNRWYR